MVCRGLLADLSFLSAPSVQHNLQYEAVWRQLSPAARTAAFAVREHSGQSTELTSLHFCFISVNGKPLYSGLNVEPPCSACCRYNCVAGLLHSCNWAVSCGAS